MLGGTPASGSSRGQGMQARQWNLEQGAQALELTLNHGASASAPAHVSGSSAGKPMHAWFLNPAFESPANPPACPNTEAGGRGSGFWD